jgi:hypothetical protein
MAVALVILAFVGLPTLVVRLLLGLRPEWSISRRSLVAALPVLIGELALLISWFTTAPDFQPETCGVDDCGMASSAKALLMISALIPYLGASAVAAIAECLFTRAKRAPDLDSFE